MISASLIFHDVVKHCDFLTHRILRVDIRQGGQRLFVRGAAQERMLGRRSFLGRVVGCGTAALCSRVPSPMESTANVSVTSKIDANTTWEEVRGLFELRADRIHMSGLLLASHPVPVRQAIAKHREELQRDPASYIAQERWRLEGEVLQSAATYLEVGPADIALTESTSMGLGLLYSGLKLTPRDEILTTNHDHYATEAAIAVCAERTGCAVKRIDMYRESAVATQAEMVDAIREAITASTRIMAITWVHSGTGVKVPIREIADLLGEINRARGSERRIYLCLDGVHGLGVENVALAELGCDFFAAGTHKWLFGPRGTGILWGRPDAWHMTRPTIPTWEIGGGQLMTPGGYHTFEHTWALGSAFDLHANLGRSRVSARVHTLNRQLKEGLRAMRHVLVHTPLDETLSAGMVCFDVQGMTPDRVVAKLAEKGVIASRTPYRTQHARLCPGLLTLGRDVERTLEAVHTLT